MGISTRNRALGGLFVALGLGLTAAVLYRLRPEPVSPEALARARRLYVQVSAEPVSLDPALVEDGAGIRILANLMDGLMGYDGQGHLRPRLAEGYRFSEDRRTLTFKLRPGIRWSDGVPVTAEQFVAGLKRSLSRETKLGAVFASVRDVRSEIGEGGAQSVRVELKHPTPFILEAFAMPMALPIRPEILLDNVGDTRQNWSPLGPTTGDYRLREITPKQSWLLEANPHALTPPRVPEVELQLVTEDATAARLFETGRLDILSRVSSLDLQKFERRGVLQSFSYFGVYFLAWNVRHAPGNSRELRRAFARALHKKELVAAINGQASPGLHEEVADSFLPPQIEGHAQHLVREPAPAKPAGAPRQIQLGYDLSSRNTLVAEKVQQDALAVGIDLKLDAREWKAFIARLREDPPDLYRFGWLTPFRDPTLNLSVWTSRDPNNYTGWSNAEYDRLVAEIARMEPGPKRVAKIHRAEEILISEEAVVVPLYYLRQTYAVSPRVKGFRANPFSVIRFGELSL